MIEGLEKITIEGGTKGLQVYKSKGRCASRQKCEIFLLYEASIGNDLKKEMEIIPGG